MRNCPCIIMTRPIAFVNHSVSLSVTKRQSSNAVQCITIMLISSLSFCNNKSVWCIKFITVHDFRFSQITIITIITKCIFDLYCAKFKIWIPYQICKTKFSRGRKRKVMNAHARQSNFPI